ncbi:MAG: hypothetical protein GY947_23225 [Rhodobacteraceae bacterium]|nr:hypothetical protein [Paracoccaceae bacterium]
MEKERGNRVRSCDLSYDSLLRQATAGAYWDCYTCRVDIVASLEAFVLAFYSSRAFWPERALLSAAGLVCRLEQAAEMVQGTADQYAAWTVEARNRDEMLMRDVRGVTRSYFSVRELERGTELRFGSGVGTGEKEMSRVMKLLQPFHRWYSRVLLTAARERLLRT